MDGRDDTLPELKEVPLTEFTQQDQARFALAPGDISWQQRDGKHFRLYRAGDPVDAPYLEKFFLNSQRLVCELLIDLPYFQTLKLYAQEYFHADLERQRIRTRDRLTSYLYPFLWEGDQEKSWLNLALAFHPELFRPELQALGFHENPDLFRRASLVGVLNVLGAMSLGYHRRNYLQDLYCLPFFQGISLRGKTTYHVEKALDAERISKGQFQNSLELLTETERELLIEHSRLDRELVEEKFSAYFENPSVVKMLAWQHERPKGGGFPTRINQDELSDIELWVSFTFRQFPAKEFSFSKTDGTAGLRLLFDRYRKHPEDYYFMGRRVFQLIESCWLQANAPGRVG